MPRHTGGDKRSSWLTFQRRLFLTRCLIRGPATGVELIANARAVLGEEIYPLDAATALRHDITALRNEFGCVIRFQTAIGYVLDHPGQLALLDLPDAELEALSFLMATFTESQLPNAIEVGTLLDRIIGLLPEERRQRLRYNRANVRLEYPATVGNYSQRVLAVLKDAVGHQQLAFTYRSSYIVSGSAIRHRVSPYGLIYRDGHTYLDAYCHEGGGELRNAYTLYRVDRIMPDSLQVLPSRLPPGKQPRRVYPLRYQIAPAVARQHDIALWFPDSQVNFSSDGTAVISANTADLWQARQILLRYREHCRVLEPPELVEMIRETLARMTATYSVELSQGPIGDDDDRA